MNSRKAGESGPPGGAKPFSVSFSNTPRKSLNTPPSQRPQGGSTVRQKHRHLTHDESDEEETEPALEEVTGFDTSAGGAISKNASSKDKEPLVIKVESKNNWRDRAGVNRSSKNLLPHEVQAASASGNEVTVGVKTETPKLAYGLNLAPTNENDAVTDNETICTKGEPDVVMTDGVSDVKPEERKPLTQDEIALQALIRETEGGEHTGRSDLVIELAKPAVRYDETTSFRADVKTRPDQASLEEYDAVPVEEFGAALLRGMGWKEGQAIGRRTYGKKQDTSTEMRVPQPRPGFLGIGAKDLSGGKGAEIEIGAWGKAAMRKGSRKGGDGSGNTEGVYMPVVMKSKTTGESLTEEEFKVRQKEAVEGKAKAKSAERSSRHATSNNGNDRDGRRRYDDESDTERDRSRRHGKSSSRRNRSRSAGDYHHRRYRYDDGGTRSARDSRRYRDRDDSDYKSRPRSRDRTDTHLRRDKDYQRARDRDRDSDRVRSDENRNRDRDRDRYRDSHKYNLDIEDTHAV